MAVAFDYVGGILRTPAQTGRQNVNQKEKEEKRRSCITLIEIRPSDRPSCSTMSCPVLSRPVPHWRFDGRAHPARGAIGVLPPQLPSCHRLLLTRPDIPGRGAGEHFEMLFILFLLLSSSSFCSQWHWNVSFWCVLNAGAGNGKGKRHYIILELETRWASSIFLYKEITTTTTTRRRQRRATSNRRRGGNGCLCLTPPHSTLQRSNRAACIHPTRSASASASEYKYLLASAFVRTHTHTTQWLEEERAGAFTSNREWYYLVVLHHCGAPLNNSSSSNGEMRIHSLCVGVYLLMLREAETCTISRDKSGTAPLATAKWSSSSTAAILLLILLLLLFCPSRDSYFYHYWLDQPSPVSEGRKEAGRQAGKRHPQGC